MNKIRFISDSIDSFGLRDLHELEECINLIESTFFRNLLSLRYLQGKNWGEISESICYSYVHTVNRLQPKALAYLREAITKKRLIDIGEGDFSK